MPPFGVNRERRQLCVQSGKLFAEFAPELRNRLGHFIVKGAEILLEAALRSAKQQITNLLDCRNLLRDIRSNHFRNRHLMVSIAALSRLRRIRCSAHSIKTPALGPRRSPIVIARLQRLVAVVRTALELVNGRTYFDNNSRLWSTTVPKAKVQRGAFSRANNYQESLRSNARIESARSNATGWRSLLREPRRLLGHGFRDQGGTILDLALAQNDADVILDRSFGELQTAAYLSVALAFDDQAENLVLAVGELLPG